MWLERFLDSIMPGLVPFMACLLALVVYDIIQRGWSFVLLTGSLFQGRGMGDYNFRGKLAVGWHRPLYCEGEVHIAINTGIRKAREGSCYRDRTRHP